MTNEQETEIKFLNGLCEAIKGLDKETQLFIAKAYLKEEKPKKEEDAFDKAVREIEENKIIVTYDDFYKKITDEMSVESHHYAKKLYDTINKYFSLRHYK